MNRYDFIAKQHRHSLQQLRCLIQFSFMALPVILSIVFLRHVCFIAFHSLLFMSGWCMWTFIEYILHRFWMLHKDSNSAMAKTHHYHHTHPTEMVITNLHRALMIIFIVALVFVARYLNDYFTLFVGFACGIAGYFWMHQFLHLELGQKLFKRLVRYHIYHHCKYPNTCFGISVPWWDDLFKTVPASPKITQRIIDFYFKGQEREDHNSMLSPVIIPRKPGAKTNSCNPDCRKCVAVRGHCGLSEYRSNINSNE